VSPAGLVMAKAPPEEIAVLLRAAAA